MVLKLLFPEKKMGIRIIFMAESQLEFNFLVLGQIHLPPLQLHYGLMADSSVKWAINNTFLFFIHF